MGRHPVFGSCLVQLYHVSLSTQVELLVMKALSVGLVRGSIDEVDKRVHMTWVQPRVLDLQQVSWLGPWLTYMGLGLCLGLGFMWTEAM